MHTKKNYEWIKCTWDLILTDPVVQSSKKCGISNSLDGSEDNLVCGTDDERMCSDYSDGSSEAYQ
jgi:hypothetical protein